MYTRIIVPFDGGEFSLRALTVGQTLAKAIAAPLRVVGFALTASHTTDLRKAMHDEIDHITDVEVGTDVRRVDDIVAAITNELADDPGALICMSSVGRSHLGPVLGSIAEGVLREDFGPVLLVGPHARCDAFDLKGPMVICTDGSETAKAIIPLAAQWAITSPLEPWIVNVRAPASARVDLELANDLGNESALAGHVAHDLERQIGRTVQYDVVHDEHPAKAIVQFADDKNAAVIAMATRGQVGVRRAVLGSVAMSVVHHAFCPVLLYQPPHLSAH